MNRRDTLLALMALGAVPITGLAQGKVWRLVFLASSKPDAKPGESDAYGMAFVAEMQAAGLTLGTDYMIEIRSLDDYQTSSTQAGDAAIANADIIIPVSPLAVAFARKASRTIPIVGVAVHDPVGMGYAASLARPGGNLTGVATFFADLIPKQLELVKAILPKVSRVALLANARIIDTHAAIDLKIRESARILGIRLQTVAIDAREQLPQAFAAMKRERAHAVITIADEMFYRERRQIAELARRQRLPSIFATRENVEAGGLMSYGEDSLEMFAHAARYVGKIMRGARPGDLPIEQPTKFQLTINRNTAKAIRLTVPQELLLRADRVID